MRTDNAERSGSVQLITCEGAISVFVATALLTLMACNNPGQQLRMVATGKEVHLVHRTIYAFADSQALANTRITQVTPNTVPDSQPCNFSLSKETYTFIGVTDPAGKWSSSVVEPEGSYYVLDGAGYGPTVIDQCDQSADIVRADLHRSRKFTVTAHRVDRGDEAVLVCGSVNGITGRALRRIPLDFRTALDVSDDVDYVWVSRRGEPATILLPDSGGEAVLREVPTATLAGNIRRVSGLPAEGALVVVVAPIHSSGVLGYIGMATSGEGGEYRVTVAAGVRLVAAAQFAGAVLRGARFEFDAIRWPPGGMDIGLIPVGEVKFRDWRFED